MENELHIRGIAIDCDDIDELANFYSRITHQPISYQSEEFACLNLSTYWLTFQRVDNYVEPTWPSSTSPKQFHLEIWTDDIDSAEVLVLEYGATKSAVQPSLDDSWRVFVDPAGHPFCLTKNIPDPASS
ncbi:MAG: VOC family protein [Acidimicrobiales bacterium]